MDNITENTVINQLISLLPFSVDHRLSLDRYAKKLTIAKSIVLFTIALMGKWSSYKDMETKVLDNEYLRQSLDLKEISGSQMSRKLDEIPTEIMQEIFLRLVGDLDKQTVHERGITQRIGKLGIIDSTSLKLPFSIGDWARISNTESGVKMHLRLMVASPDTVYPDQMVPSTRNVDDREVLVEMVTDADVTYVMDRGYVKYSTMDTWVCNNTQFVIRINEKHRTTIVEEREVTSGSRIRRDAIVLLGGKFRSMKRTVRLIEFVDEKGRLYRVVTSRMDLTAEEIADIYRHRWQIELYFKWMKQHLRLVKLFSYKPQAVWNQLFMALIGHLLVLKLKEQIQQPKKTAWDILRILTNYWEKTWKSFLEAVERKPKRTSKGRQKIPESEKTVNVPLTGIGIIKPMKPRKEKVKKVKKEIKK
jgi:hypothetical protein